MFLGVLLVLHWKMIVMLFSPLLLGVKFVNSLLKLVLIRYDLLQVVD